VALTPRTERMIDRAVELLNSNNNHEALRLFDLVIAESDLQGLEYGKATALARLGNIDEAVITLKKLLRLIPNHPKAQLFLVELLASERSIQLAEKNYARRSKEENRQSQWLPSNLYPDDVFLVSYPKSGNTWVRFLLANLLKKEDEEIDFFSVHQHIPEVGSHEQIINSLTRPRIMKSHAPFIREYTKVIYLVRDGRDVYVSYYYHRLKQLPKRFDFFSFLQRRDHYPCRWGEHVASWTMSKDCSNLLVVKFEDLKSDCFKQMDRILKFLNVNRPKHRIEKAIEASSFENMKRIESEKGRLYKKEGPEVFMRKGITGDWKNYYGTKEKDYYKSFEGQLLIKLKYEKDNNW